LVGVVLALLGAVAVLAPATALAQAGPPLVTDDPDTPGDGHWEINLAALGGRSRLGRWDVSAPDADINYGWGEHVQLKLDIPWAFAGEPGQPWRSGLGQVNAGVKWRFVDEDERGFAMSIYPQYLSNWNSSSSNRGITPPDSTLFLPLEVAGKLGSFSVDGEVGRALVEHHGGNWVLGGVVGHGCGEGLECQFEIHKNFEPGNSQTLLNLGLHWKLSESLVLLAALGREVGPRVAEQQVQSFYLGLQFLR
jgi:hypothetical protein